MVVAPMYCPTWQGRHVVKHGNTSDGKPRFRCQDATCPGVTCMRAYVYQGRLPSVKRQIIDRSLNASGVRDIARVLRVSPTTVMQELIKRASTASRQAKPESI